MLKGLALTPPVIGRISIGKVVEKNGKRLPEKDDEFTVTSQVQMKDVGADTVPIISAIRRNHYSVVTVGHPKTSLVAVIRRRTRLPRSGPSRR